MLLSRSFFRVLQSRTWDAEKQCSWLKGRAGSTVFTNTLNRTKRRECNWDANSERVNEKSHLKGPKHSSLFSMRSRSTLYFLTILLRFACDSLKKKKAHGFIEGDIWYVSQVTKVFWGFVFFKLLIATRGTVCRIKQINNKNSKQSKDRETFLLH